MTLEVHHIEALKNGGSDEPSNLVALCGNCHILVTRGDIPEESVRLWKGLLVALNDAFDRRSMDLLLFLHSHQDSGVPMVYSADGVLQFVPLIAAKLVKIGSSSYTSGGRDGSVAASGHQLTLTPKGRTLVEVWSAGDQRAFERIVGEIDT